MANEENLKKGKATQFKGDEENRRLAAEAGKASGRSKRRKKALKQRLIAALECDVENDTAKKIAKTIGVMPEDATNYDVIVARLILQAFKGDIRAMQMVFEYIGETPAEKRAEKTFKAEMEQREKEDVDSRPVIQIIADIPKDPPKTGTDTAVFNPLGEPETGNIDE